jgi:hypothetical protein
VARKSKKSDRSVAVAMPNPKVGAKPSKAILALERAALAQSAGKAPSAPPPPRQARISIDVPEGTPGYYSNYIEIGHTKWDFSLIASRLPAKPSSAKIVEMQASGILNIPADVTISFPPHLMPGLIRALTTQKETFEKTTGIQLKEKTDERNVQAKHRKRRRG